MALGLPDLLGHTSEVLAAPGKKALASGTFAEVATGDREAATLTKTLFNKLSPSDTGVDFVNPIDSSHPMSRLYHSGFMCGSVALGDLDGDGLVDIFLTSGPRSNALYRQVSTFQFEDVTAASGLEVSDRWASGCSLVDIDGDRDLDIYVCNYDAPNELFLNDGKGHFTESAKSWGLDLANASLTPAFCDYDNDGDLDCYLLTNRLYREGGLPAAKAVLKKTANGLTIGKEYQRYYKIKGEFERGTGVTTYGQPDVLLRNDGDTFTDVTKGSGIAGHGYGLSVVWWDYDNDGWMDIYVANDFDDPDRLYRNRGDGTFEETSKDTLPHTSWFSMGSDAADINNDGLLDLLVVDMSATNHYKQKTTMGAMNSADIAAVSGPPPQLMRNALFINTGTGRFLEAAYFANLADSDWSWAVKFADFDLDSHVDVFISNGMSRNFNDSDFNVPMHKRVGLTDWEVYKDRPTRPEQNLAFRNTGHLHFEDVSQPWGLDHYGMSFSTAYADFDNDGDLDLVIANLDEPVSIYRNLAVEKQPQVSRARVDLIGNSKNSLAIGAKVELTTSEGKQVRQMMPATGFLSFNQPALFFGLGEATQIQQLKVTWPDQSTQVMKELPVNRAYTLKQADSDLLADQSANTSGQEKGALFKELSPIPELRHYEKPFDDFALQPLQPNQLSQLGPGLATGDVDGDGDDDLFFGGTARNVGRLFIRPDSGQLEPTEDLGELVFDEDAMFGSALASEDMGSLLFDADGDGDVDLYVASGSVEFGPDSELLKDRLYLNDGHGKFTAAPDGALPDLKDSSGVVAAADFDRDGDLDLFVGSRVVPGSYPIAPRSRLLRNDAGVFTDVSTEVADGLQEAGLVTSALWTDVNGDNSIDLLLTIEWGPVKVFLNQQGKLVDQTEQSGLADDTGWWNGIAGGDLDNDGDTDYVVTNFGRNSKYHASRKKPAILYYGDFEENGQMRLVEAEYEGDHLFPIRGKSCSTNAMPSLANKFTSYHEFAKANLAEIYTLNCLEESYQLSATNLNSVVLVNDGQGHFEVRSLPWLAQISTGFAVSVFDVNTDGNADIFIGQNFFGPQPETGPVDGGVGLLLLGDGSGDFTPAWPTESGIVVPGESRSSVWLDVAGDEVPELVVATNNGPVQIFALADRDKSDFLAVSLKGPAGNAEAIGAAVFAEYSNGQTQKHEIYAGGGYLSQGTTKVWLPQSKNLKVTQITIVWPDGQKTVRSLADDDVEEDDVEDLAIEFSQD